MGIRDVNITTKINEELKQEVKREIKEKRVDIEVTEKKEENIIVMGENIKSKVSTIDSIVSEENNVTVEAYVFKVDEFESSKSAFKILTFSISDNTDSITCKFFTKEQNRESSFCSKNANF